jgi:peroxidase
MEPYCYVIRKPICDCTSAAGAHTIGQAHCSAFWNRLSPFYDRTLDAAFARSLLYQCPQGSSTNATEFLDLTTPTIFDAAYFGNLHMGLGLLTSDAELQFDSESTSRLVRANTDFDTFATNFKSSMIAMGNIDVLTGSAGEIRSNCRRFNSKINP